MTQQNQDLIFELNSIPHVGDTKCISSYILDARTTIDADADAGAGAVTTNNNSNNNPVYSTVSQEVFLKRLHTLVPWLSSTNNQIPFNWTNVFLAGGLITSLLTNYEPTSEEDAMNKIKQSDVDLFVYGLQEEELKEKMQNIYQFILDWAKTNDFCIAAFVMSMNRKMITILIDGHLPVQIIGMIKNTDFSSKKLVVASVYEVIDSFDLSHCQAAFDGQQLKYTPQFKVAMQSKVTEIMCTSDNRPIHLFRLIKAYSRGFSVLDTPAARTIKVVNYMHRYRDLTDVKYQQSVERIRQWNNIHTLQSSLSEIMADPMVQFNLNKYKERFTQQEWLDTSLLCKKIKTANLFISGSNMDDAVLNILYVPSTLHGGRQVRDVKGWIWF